jgi:hypothetical protein
MKSMNRQQTISFWLAVGMAIGAGIGMVLNALVPGIV